METTGPHERHDGNHEIDRRLGALFQAETPEADRSRLSAMSEALRARASKGAPGSVFRGWSFRGWPLQGWLRPVAAAAFLGLLVVLGLSPWRLGPEKPELPASVSRLADIAGDDVALEQVVELLSAFAEEGAATGGSEGADRSDAAGLGLDPLAVETGWQSAAGLL